MTRAVKSDIKGLSLIELMIALVLGSILMIGVIQVFAASRSSYALAEGLSRVQENARFAMDYLQRDLRMVGHYGCVNDQFRLQQPGQLTSHFTAGGQLDFTRTIQGFEANGSAPGASLTLASAASGWTPALPGFLGTLNPAPQPGSDIILMRFLTPEGIPVIGLGNSAAPGRLNVDPAKWSVLTNGGVANPRLFAIADCTFTDVFHGTSVNSSTGVINATQTGLNVSVPNFNSRYTSSPAGQTILYRAEAIVYYVGALPGRDGPSLWRARLDGSNNPVEEELVEGIENIQLLYGRDQSTDPTNLTGNVAVQNTATELAAIENEWRRVGQVQVGVLARSPNPSAAATPQNAPRLLGTQLTLPTDSRYRATYESSVALRNRLYSNN